MDRTSRLERSLMRLKLKLESVSFFMKKERILQEEEVYGGVAE